MRDGTNSYEVQWGTSGGFTGGGEGYILYSDGRLARWKKRTAAAQIETNIIGNLSPNACAQLYRIIEENKLFQLKQADAGNMTTSVIIRYNGKEHGMSWPAAPGKTPMKLVPLIEQLQAAVSAVQK